MHQFKLPTPSKETALINFIYIYIIYMFIYTRNRITFTWSSEESCEITCKLKYSKELLDYKFKNAKTYTIIRVTMSHGVLTLRRTSKFIPPPWYKGGGWMEPHHGVFDMLKYFETILPLVESVWSSWQAKVYWWCCWRPVTSPTMVAILAAILDFTKNWKSG